MERKLIPDYKVAEKRRRLFRGALVLFFIIVQVLWIGLPVAMAVLWSLVNPDYPWSYPEVFPTHLSLAQWDYVFKYTDIIRAITTSYSIAPAATLLTFLLSLPTAYVLGRRNFPGREAIKILILLPIIMPGMVVALFLSRVFDYAGLSQNFFGVMLGHTLMAMPYMLRILTTSFEAIPQDIIDAAENLGANNLVKFKEIFIPMVLPGLLAGTIFSFITSLEEFNLTFVIGTPTYETIPTILFAFLGYHFIRTNAAVVALILMIPNITMLFIAERFIKTEYLAAAFGKM
jgi:putative spermidine/putrescine transport system permease protein